MPNPSPEERLAPPESELSAPSPSRAFTLRTAAVLACVWILSLAYLGFYLKRGWVPHDDGMYAQSAERVLQGQLPHRDFDEGYTGGLTFLNALAFRALGVNLLSLRILLFSAFAFWVPSVFYLATRFVSPLTAGAVTLLCVAWSVPNYPADSPSWYNLFFAVFGICAVLRYLEFGSRRWLFVAGICAGLSILSKITGFYFVAALFLFFVFREQSVARTLKGKAASGSGWPFKAFVSIALVLFISLLTNMIRRNSGLGNFIYFLLPNALLVILLLYREFKYCGGSNKLRFSELCSMLIPFSSGILTPIALFLIPFWLSNSVGALLHGVFGVLNLQFQFASTASPSPVMLLAVLPTLVVIVLGTVSHRQGQLVYGAILALYFATILVLSPNNSVVYAQGWYSIGAAVPIITMANVFLLGHRGSVRRLGGLRQQQLMLITSAMALISLVRFPFTVPIYFYYMAPLAILASMALLASRPARFASGTLIAFYILFALLQVTPSSNTEHLTIPRSGGLLIHPDQAHIYDQVISTVQVHAQGQFIFASPDCPEIYFLSGLQNPTRTFFDFRDDPTGRDERILRALESHGVNVVAIDREPQFSGPLDATLANAFERLYPESEVIDHFTVRWRTNGSDKR